MSQRASTTALEQAARKWRALADRRCADLVALFRSGRWKRYYSEEQFLHQLRDAIRASERWAEIAPVLRWLKSSMPVRPSARRPDPAS
jgi:uncharacterized repeat protein (TIGR03809 family)